MILQKRKVKVELICESYLSGALTCTGGTQKRADGVVSAKYSEIYFLVFCFYFIIFCTIFPETIMFSLKNSIILHLTVAYLSFLFKEVLILIGLQIRN